MFIASRMFDVLCLLYVQQLFSSGTADLPPPCNVSFVSENFQHALKWEAGDPGSVATNYTVEYISFKNLSSCLRCSKRKNIRIVTPRNNGNEWQPVHHCSHTPQQMCDLTEIFPAILNTYCIRVKAVTEAEDSKWISTDEFQPCRDTKLRAANAHLVDRNGNLQIRFDFAELPPIIKNEGIDSLIDIFGKLNYYITIAKDGKVE
uniref:Fibronectin type-III domain-containing protein n=1 Tax=Callorhinchus milii TaxID=7868 RepID=A0A4W3K5F4_CALMI